MTTPVLTAFFGDEMSRAQVTGLSKTLSELVESLETITGVSAVDVLGIVYQQLGDDNDGVIVLNTEPGVGTMASSAAAFA